MRDTAVTVRGRPAARAEANGFARVYERHHQALYRYCRSILRHEEDAQDALQSAMMRAFAALQTERGELELRPWLFRIAHNEAVSILRRRTATCALDEDLRDSAALEDRVLEREALRLLRADLAGLTERQRWALVLRELNGLSHDEIAGVLETSPAVVKQAIFEARSALLRCREGRDTACADIRLVLSDGDGRVLRARRVRAHLQTCSGCRAFRDDLRVRPRRLAALAPPLPAGLAATLLRGALGGSAGAASAGGGLVAKAALGVALAGGTVAWHVRPLMPVHRPAPAPSVHATAIPAEAVPAPPLRPAAVSRAAVATPGRARGHELTPVPAGATHRPTAPGHTARGQATKPGRATPPPQRTTQTTAAAPPGEANTTAGAIPPGQAQKAAPAPPAGQAQKTAPAIPPGQAKKTTGGTPPGQAKKAAGATPPGQAKKAAGATPPGQAKKAAGATPPGQAKKAAGATPPGQAKKAADPTTPPGQAKKAPGGTAAGETNPAAGATPPGQPNPAAGATPPGQAKKAADPATPPGQAKKAAGATPPASAPGD